MKIGIFTGTFNIQHLTLLKQVSLHNIACIRISAEMLVGKRRCHSASRRALDETLHDEERLVNLLYGAAILAYCRGNSAYAYRTATELVDDGGENLIINLIQAILVDIECLERHLGNIVSDGSVALYLGEITHPSYRQLIIAKSA